jgi:predicted transglutaminase-like cysteine proteinase
LAPLAHVRFCQLNPGDCRAEKIVFRGGLIDLTPQRLEEIKSVNTFVNRAIHPQDMHEAVADEKWIILPKYGDCNDYAVSKRHELLARGWPARSLLLAEVITTWGEHHLVLVVRTKQGDLVADNLSPKIRVWSATPYEWVRIQTPANPTFWANMKRAPSA